MKTIKFYALLLFSILAVNFSFAQKTAALNKKETIKVAGNCESCKKRIETAAKTAGATTASWNEESGVLAVSYDSAKTSSAKIQQAIPPTIIGLNFLVNPVAKVGIPYMIRKSVLPWEG